VKIILRSIALTPALLLAVAGCGGSPSPTEHAEPPIAAALARAQPGELVAHVRTLVRQRGETFAKQTEAGQTTNIPRVSLAGEPVMLAQTTSSEGAPSASPAADAGIAYTGTTMLQEAGVDEDDLIKTDGRLIYALQRAGWEGGRSRPDRLHRYERQPDGSLTEPVILEIPTDERTHTSMRGMLFAPQAERIALVGEANTWFAPIDCPPDRACILGGPRFYSAPKTIVQWVDASSPIPTLGERLEFDGRLIGTRRIGDYLYLVISHSPQLAAESIWQAASSPTDKDEALAAIGVSDVLPTVTLNGAESRTAVDETDCHLQTANQSSELQITTVLAFDMKESGGASGPSWTGRCFLGGTEALYMAPASLYLATSRYPVRTDAATGRVTYSAQAQTDVHKFAIDGLSISYRGSGEVAGHLGWDRERAAYRMSEYRGNLRVVSFTDQTGWASVEDASSQGPQPSPATLTVLREEPNGSGRLLPVATLPNSGRSAPLGKPGEQIYGVRFAGDRAYLVTFRQIDPLYVVDLSDPADPRIRGELEIPGYSDYLFPLPGELLLGIGKDASSTGQVGGIKLGLYDLANPDTPQELSTMIIGGAGSVSTMDYSSQGVSLYTFGLVTRGALPVWLSPSGADAPTGRGLQMFEIDSASRKLVSGKLLEGFEIKDAAGIESDRGLMIDGDVYYWVGGVLFRSE
jgi:hypothetical protein